MVCSHLIYWFSPKHTCSSRADMWEILTVEVSVTDHFSPRIPDFSYAPFLLCSSSSRPASYHRLRARAFPGEEVPEISSGRLFALVLWRLSHPDAAVRGAAQTGAAATACAASTAADTTQGEAQRGAERAPAVVVVGILTVESGEAGRRRLGQAEQVVVGVELTHVADGFTLRDVP